MSLFPIEILDIRSLRHAARNKETDHTHAGECSLEECRCGSVMRPRREDIIEESNHPWRRVLQCRVDRIIRLDILRSWPLRLIVHRQGAGTLNDQFAYIDRWLHPYAGVIARPFSLKISPLSRTGVELRVTAARTQPFVAKIS